jgi:hypothetical protein
MVSKNNTEMLDRPEISKNAASNSSMRGWRQTSVSIARRAPPCRLASGPDAIVLQVWRVRLGCHEFRVKLHSAAVSSLWGQPCACVGYLNEFAARRAERMIHGRRTDKRSPARNKWATGLDLSLAVHKTGMLYTFQSFLYVAVLDNLESGTTGILIFIIQKWRDVQNYVHLDQSLNSEIRPKLKQYSIQLIMLYRSILLHSFHCRLLCNTRQI